MPTNFNGSSYRHDAQLFKNDIIPMPVSVKNIDNFLDKVYQWYKYPEGFNYLDYMPAVKRVFYHELAKKFGSQFFSIGANVHIQMPRIEMKIIGEIGRLEDIGTYPVPVGFPVQRIKGDQIIEDFASFFVSENGTTSVIYSDGEEVIVTKGGILFLWPQREDDFQKCMQLGSAITETHKNYYEAYRTDTLVDNGGHSQIVCSDNQSVWTTTRISTDDMVLGNALGFGIGLNIGAYRAPQHLSQFSIELSRNIAIINVINVWMNEDH